MLYVPCDLLNTDSFWLNSAGTTYNPDQGAIQGVSSLDTGLAAIAEVCAANNESAIEAKGGTFRAVGAPTEAALKVRVVAPANHYCSFLQGVQGQ